MGLLSFLDDPASGQVLSAYVLLTSLAIFWLFIAMNLFVAILAGKTIEVGPSDWLLLISFPVMIKLFKFLRSWHASR